MPFKTFPNGNNIQLYVPKLFHRVKISGRMLQSFFTG